jgi:carbamoyl-phosphate synthase large subunit
MPKRTDIKTILIIGSGPIVIGQACEFDYSGTQACKALREEGYNIVLVNSNPATIMTDPEFSDRTYIEPITPEAVTKIIEKELNGPYHIDALLPTIGGQTALNTACALYDSGVLDKYKVEMIGATRDVIHRAEDRKIFGEIVKSVGLSCPKSGIANSMEDCWNVLEQVGLPAIIRPAFTLGGTGGGIAYNREEFEDICRRGLDASMTKQILIDQSLIGWKEYELEVVRDHDDNVIIICTIENFDAMGVHTGDSITVAPSQTLTDREYQRLRDASIAIIRAVGVDTGGSNIQFGISPTTGEIQVIEMNPRVSRSSALASKATGFPIAKIAAKLAVGYSLWELPNDITGETAASFEPSIDYVVTKIPRWTFEKFPEADETLTTQMKSVGEAMSIGRTFKESLQKGIRSMEVKRFGFGLDGNDKCLMANRGDRAADGSPIEWPIDEDKLRRKLSVPSQGRLYYVRYALKMGMSIEEIYELSHFDPWFLDQLKQLVDFEETILSYKRLEDMPREVLFQAKQLGYSDAQLANVFYGNIKTDNILAVRDYRKKVGINPVYKLVDTCAAEFEATTPYYYSTYEAPYMQVAPNGSSAELYDDEIRVTDKKKIIILGGGPNRIGQGIEFDYCCVQAVFAAKELGFEAVMINSNPETVSTDYDTSDLLFFEPLTLEDVLNIFERLDAGKGLVHGVIVQFGGQTPLNLAHGLQKAGVPIIGTSVESIDIAEDREHFADLCRRVDVKQPNNGIAYDVEQAIVIANRISYPVLVRPSFVLGGRAMETVFDDEQLRHYMKIAISASDIAGQPILIDKFLNDAIECDVDVVADFGPMSQGKPTTALVCGVMEHIEEAGVHSGDSACTIPPYSLPADVVETLKKQSRDLAEALHVRGLMNVQWAIKRPNAENSEYEIFVLEVNPRASRTVPFVSKATDRSWARIAAKVMAGKQLTELGITDEIVPSHTSVKESVFPFSKFPGVDVVLGPEMRSTGEVMGADPSYPIAFAKSQMGAGAQLPTSGKVFISLKDCDKKSMIEPARKLVALGFKLIATKGTHEILNENNIENEMILKIRVGRPNAIDLIKNGELALIINTPTRKGIATDEGRLRATAVRFKVPMITTATGATAAVLAMEALREGTWTVRALQDYQAGV